MRDHIIALADTENPRQVRAGDRRHLAHHAGQLLQRFFADTMIDPKSRRKRDKRDPEEFKALFKAAIAACNNQSVGEIYTDAYARWTKSFPANGSHQAKKLAVNGRLIVGLGAENVLETGLRLHHTYGTPIIPGSALKGLASHYCHEVWGPVHNPEAAEENHPFRRGGTHHKLLFGTTDDGGVITFHDAWIVPETLPDALRLDVMTPHHRKWQTNEAAPTDFDSPTPVSFLSVAGTFDLRLSWSGPQGVDDKAADDKAADDKAADDKAADWTALAMKLLQAALDEWGVGGKTSSGYGRLVPADEVQSVGRAPAVIQTNRAATLKAVALPKTNETVKALLLEERTKNGGWRATDEQSGLSGPIENTGEVPADKNPGDKLDLIVKSVSAHRLELTFQYRPPEELERVQQAPRKPPTSPVRGKRQR